MGIKIGNIDASYFKVGSGDCSIYLGDTKLYPTAQPSYKLQATYLNGDTYNAECDENATLTSATTKPSGYEFSAMTDAVIGGCIDIVNYGAFNTFTNLSSVTISDGVRSLYSNAFRNCPIISISLPNSVKTLGEYTFRDCTSLTSVNIPSGVTYIAQGVFQGCTSLSSVTIPIGMTYSGFSASMFNGCSSLTSITIPSSVTKIGGQAFYNCSSLQSITVLATTPPTLGGGAIYNTNNCPIYVPAESVNTYKAATNWSSYASRIQAIPTLQWVSYSEADSVPNYGVYGIKFQSTANYEYVEYPSYIQFIDGNNNYVSIYYDGGTWYVETSSGTEEIMFDGETDYATIIFDDYGVGAATIDEMVLSSTGIPFDMQLYELN